MKSLVFLFASSLPIAAFAAPALTCESQIAFEAWDEIEKTFKAATGPISFEEVPVNAASLYAAHRTGYLPERGGIWELPTIRGIVHLPSSKINKSARKQTGALLETHPDLQITFNGDPESVIDGCAEMERASEPWLTADVIEGYKELARMGIVFSVELWEEGQLVAGNFGLISNGHVQGVSMFRDLSHPLANGGGALVTQAEYTYFASRGVETMDVEVATLSVKGPKLHVQGIPAAEFSLLLAQQNTMVSSSFPGAEKGKPLPAFQSDFPNHFRQMRQTRNYFYSR